MESDSSSWIESLPYLVYCTIFKYLQFEDLKNLRLSSRRMEECVVHHNDRFHVFKINFKDRDGGIEFPGEKQFFALLTDLDLDVPTNCPNKPLQRFLQKVKGRTKSLRIVSKKLSTHYNVIRKMKNLQKIDVWGWDSKYLLLVDECSERLRCLKISESDPCRTSLTNVFPVLTVLKLSYCINVVAFLNSILPSSPSLEVLEIEAANLSGLQTIKMKKLRTLTLVNCAGESGYAALFESCRDTLLHLHLIKQDFSKVNIPHCQFERLKTMKIVKCRKKTVQMIARLIQHPTLQSLTIDCICMKYQLPGLLIEQFYLPNLRNFNFNPEPVVVIWRQLLPHTPGLKYFCDKALGNMELGSCQMYP